MGMVLNSISPSDIFMKTSGEKDITKRVKAFLGPTYGQEWLNVEATFVISTRMQSFMKTL